MDPEDHEGRRALIIEVTIDILIILIAGGFIVSVLFGGVGHA